MPPYASICPRQVSASAIRLGFSFPKTGRDLVNPLDLPARECEPLDTAITVGLSGRFEHAALPQEHSDGITLSDHAFNLGLLARYKAVVPPGGFNNFAAPSPAPIHGVKSANVKFNIVGQGLSQGLIVALDDGAVNAVKNGLRVIEVVGCGGAHGLEEYIGVFAVHEDRV